MQRTDVYYVVPSDGDDFAHPNVFTVKCSAKKLTLSRIAKSFPIPGRYHFRFKMKWRETFVWLDVTEPSVNVPLFRGSVFIKAARIRTKRNIEPVARQNYDAPAHVSDDESSAPDEPARQRRPSIEKVDDTPIFNIDDDDSSTHTNDGDDLFPVTPEMQPVKAPSAAGDFMGEFFATDNGTSDNNTSAGTTHIGADEDELSLFFQ